MTMLKKEDFLILETSLGVVEFESEKIRKFTLEQCKLIGLEKKRNNQFEIYWAPQKTKGKIISSIFNLHISHFKNTKKYVTISQVLELSFDFKQNTCKISLIAKPVRQKGLNFKTKITPEKALSYDAFLLYKDLLNEDIYNVWTKEKEYNDRFKKMINV